jgi:hypothetical protein
LIRSNAIARAGNYLNNPFKDANRDFFPAKQDPFPGSISSRSRKFVLGFQLRRKTRQIESSPRQTAKLAL